MNYSGFGVLAIKGIQELTPVIEEQKEINAEQKDEITTLKNRVDKLEEILRTFNLMKWIDRKAAGCFF